MHGKLTQPKIDGYISWLRRNDHFGMTSCIYDDKSQKLLDELFELLEQVAPESPNGVRTLWLRAERGPIEDFGNAAEEIEEGNYDSEEEFIDAWKSWFPEDVKWYHFQAVEDKAEGYRAVAVRHSYVIVQDTYYLNLVEFKESVGIGSSSRRAAHDAHTLDWSAAGISHDT